MTDPDIELVVVKKCARFGYTKMLLNAIGYFATHDPRSQMVVQPTVDDARGFSKEEVDPMARDVRPVSGVLRDKSSTHDKKNEIQRKIYPGGKLLFVGSNSPRGFRRVQIDVAISDECDGYKLSAGREGNPLLLMIGRTKDSPRPKVIIGSTPTETGVSNIDAQFEKTDKRELFLPCHCGHMQSLKWANFRFGKDGRGTADKPVFVCVECDADITEGAVRSAVAKGLGVWTPTRDVEREGPPAPKSIGFSPNAFILADKGYRWARIANDFMQCGRDRQALQVFFNTVLGLSFGDKVQSVDSDLLFRRREAYPADCPNAVRLVTAFVDVQADRFEILFVGWGADEESWVLAHERLYGDLDKPQVWNMLRQKLGRKFVTETGRQVSANVVQGMDAGYRQSEVKRFCKRDAWRLIPTKGDAHGNEGFLFKFPRAPDRDGVRFTNVGPGVGKDTIYSRYALTIESEKLGGPAYIHHPVADWCDDEYFRQATAEVRRTKHKHGHAFYVWELPSGRRNEILDLLVGNLVMMRIACQFYGVTLDAPPPAPPAPKQPRSVSHADQGDWYSVPESPI